MAIVTISRGSYSGGRILADCVGKRLGYRVIAREDNIEAAASTYGVPAEKLSSEKAPSILERFGGATETFPYLTYIRAALAEHAKSGNLVYHGNLGHLVLADFPNVLRVRVVAGMEYRVNAVMLDQRVSPEQAQAYIKRVDREREEWVRSLFGVHWEDTNLYHVVLNVSLLGIDAACEVVSLIAGLPQFAPTPETLQRMEDLTLASVVTAVLAREGSNDPSTLNVESEGGVVTVSGVARTQAAADAIPGLVGKLPGVREVRNNVSVTQPAPRRRNRSPLDHLES